MYRYFEGEKKEKKKKERKNERKNILVMWLTRLLEGPSTLETSCFTTYKKMYKVWLFYQVNKMIVAFSASADNMILAFIVIFLAELSLAPVLFAIFLYFLFIFLPVTRLEDIFYPFYCKLKNINMSIIIRCQSYNMYLIFYEKKNTLVFLSLVKIRLNLMPSIYF